MKSKAPPRAAGVVVFRRTGAGIYFLVLRAYNTWDFPKGLVEAGGYRFEMTNLADAAAAIDSMIRYQKTASR